MNIEEVERQFGNLNQACIALEIAPQNMTRWRQRGYIPLLQQYRIAELTDGKLMPDELDPAKVYKQFGKV